MKFLAEDKLQTLLEELAGSAQVIAPAREEGLVAFRAWEPGMEPELDVLLTRQSAKEFIFKQSEEYLTYRYTMEGEAGVSEEDDEGSSENDEGGPAEIAHETIKVEAGVEAAPQVLFGLRPCDARGFAQIDNVFSGYGGFYFDPMYNAHRDATTILAVACVEPRSTCFCTSLEGSPSGTEGVDALFTPVEGGFTVEALTEKGREVVASPALAEAEGPQEEAAAKVKQEAEGKVDQAFSLEGVRENLQANFEEGEAWDELAGRCISCGTCTYVCPNCYCFNITDHKVETSGERFRTWDNCFNPSYTLETSGHNPRQTKRSRFRNRFSHKFWYYPEKYDSLLCSGCGRCITHCPVRIDLREVVREMGSPRSADTKEEA